MTQSVVLGLILALASTAGAQQMVPVGARVRVSLGESQRQQGRRFARGLVIRGEVTAETAESLWVKPTRVTGSVGIAKPGIRALYQSRGVPTRVGSFFIEATAGAIIGMLEVAIFKSMPADVLFKDRSWGYTIGHGAAAGAALGGLLGFFWPMEYWRRVRLD